MYEDKLALNVFLLMASNLLIIIRKFFKINSGLLKNLSAFGNELWLSIFPTFWGGMNELLYKISDSLCFNVL